MINDHYMLSVSGPVELPGDELKNDKRGVNKIQESRPWSTFCSICHSREVGHSFSSDGVTPRAMRDCTVNQMTEVD